MVQNGISVYQQVNQKIRTKIYGASGKVKFPGLWELPFGTTAREVIEEHAGGMRDGLKLKAWLPGGASTDFYRRIPLIYQWMLKPL